MSFAVHDWKHLPDPDPSVPPRLIRWFEAYGRAFPWRGSVSPYHILCAEVMLQRTRAFQVVPVFVEFCGRYRTPADLLEAGPTAAVEVFRSLGLTWRGELFWRLHQVLVEEHGGEVPSDSHELKALPGVGEYASAAVQVFAFGERTTVVDSNVLRVLGRYHCVTFPEYARRSRRVIAWAAALAPSGSDECRMWNWALIDMGAIVCTPGAPGHGDCPIAEGCCYASLAKSHPHDAGAK